MKYVNERLVNSVGINDLEWHPITIVILGEIVISITLLLLYPLICIQNSYVAMTVVSNITVLQDTRLPHEDYLRPETPLIGTNIVAKSLSLSIIYSSIVQNPVIYLYSFSTNSF